MTKPRPAVAARQTGPAPRLSRPGGGRGHAHHWRCEPPNGPTVPAICTICGASRAFRPIEESGKWRRWKELAQ